MCSGVDMHHRARQSGVLLSARSARCLQGGSVAIQITPIHTIHPDMPLTTALSMLLEAGVSALPVVDDHGVLLDVYARGDITLLARSNAYSRLQYEELSVGAALSLVGGSGTGSGSQPGSQTGAGGTGSALSGTCLAARRAALHAA